MGAKIDAVLERLTLTKLVVVFCIFASFVGLVGAVGFLRLADDAVTVEKHRLSSLAQMKANQISDWIGERRSDLYANARNDVFRELLVSSHLAETSHWQDRFSALYADQRVSKWLVDTNSMFGYRSAEVINRTGEAIISVGVAPYTDQDIRPLLGQALRSDKAALLDIRLDREGVPYVAFGAQIPDAAADVPLILIYSLAITERFLPMLNDWPNPSRTGEMLLYRIDGNEVSLLNRMQEGARDFVHFSTADPEQPIHKALLGGPGIYSGSDFRGRSVLAAIQQVPGTPWWISAKIEESELYSPIYRLAWICGSLALAGIAIAGALLALLWQQQQRRLAVAHDLSKKLRVASVQAEIANRAKSLFLANMSHEIRTPLNAVIGFSHLALKTELTAKQQDYLVKISTEGSALLNIINDILDFSKIEAGKLDLEETAFWLDDLLHSIVALEAPKAQQKGLELLVRVDPHVPLGLLGDPHRLRQVILNLLTNAIKFTDKGQVMVDIVQIGGDGDGVELELSVKDTGIGLSDDQRVRLFSSFTQADSSTTRKYGGTGLGLVISKRIVELMQGAITVESTLGQGCKFICTMKLRRSNETRHGHRTLQQVDGLRALVVDDNAAACQILAEQLRGFAFRVDGVSNAQAAMEQLEACDSLDPYALVLMDWKMPGLDGIAATRTILNSPLVRHKPAIVIVTALGSEEARDEGVHAGARAFLDKPVSRSQLWDTVAELFVPNDSDVDATRSAPVQAVKDPALNMKVLVVEDSEINQQIAVELLASLGVEATVRCDGQEALKLLLATPEPLPWSMVFMDLQMPVMDGHRATMEIRKIPRFHDLPIVAMTAHALREVGQRCLDEGMNEHLTKPIQEAALIASLRRWGKPHTAALVTTAAPVFLPSAEAVASTTGPSRVAWLSIPGIQSADGMRNCAHQEAFYKSLLYKYADALRTAAARLREACEASDWSSAMRVIHSVKGTSRNLGANACGRICEHAERDLQGVTDAKIWSLQVHQLETVFLRLERDIVACLGGADAPLEVDSQSPGLRSTDPERILSELELLLHSNSVDAIALCTRNQKVLRQVLPERFDAIHEKVRDFEFETALCLLLQEAHPLVHQRSKTAGSGSRAGSPHTSQPSPREKIQA